MLCTPSPAQGLMMGEQRAQQRDGHSQAVREHCHHPTPCGGMGPGRAQGRAGLRAGQGSGLPWEQMVICSSAGPDGPQGLCSPLPPLHCRFTQTPINI